MDEQEYDSFSDALWTELWGSPTAHADWCKREPCDCGVEVNQ